MSELIVKVNEMKARFESVCGPNRRSNNNSSQKKTEPKEEQKVKKCIFSKKCG